MRAGGFKTSNFHGFDAIEWSKLRRFRWLPVTVAAACLIFTWIQIIVAPRGDFHGHWEFGRKMAQGVHIAEDPACFMYLPFWGMMHAPLSLIRMHLAQILVYPLAGISIAVLIQTVRRLSEKHLPLSKDALFWSTTMSIFLASTFLVRDLPEVGINTFLVALPWLGVYMWSKNRDWSGGILLGMAAAMKSTPLLFIAWFVLKRQWKMVLASCIAYCIFTVSPVLIMGFDQYSLMVKSWAHRVATAGDPDPSRGPHGEENVQNLSLRPALARYLMHLPYGHLGRPETSDVEGAPNAPPNPLYFQFLDLPPFWAGVAANALMAALLLGIAWTMRRKPTDRSSFDLVWECAALSILIPLYSPVTWVQSCTGVLPGLYLVCRTRFAGLAISGWSRWAMGGYVLFCVILNRGLFGRAFVKLVNGYRLKTIGMLLLLSVVITMGSRVAKLASELNQEPKPF